MAEYEIPVYPDLEATEPTTVIGIQGGELITDIRTHRDLGFDQHIAPLPWRQGVKHDAAVVMELALHPGGFLVNKRDEMMEVESEYIYPLLKSSNIYNPEKLRSDKFVLLTQRHPREDTLHLARLAPRLWAYLQSHAAVFDLRESHPSTTLALDSRSSASATTPSPPTKSPLRVSTRIPSSGR